MLLRQKSNVLQHFARIQMETLCELRAITFVFLSWGGVLSEWDNAYYLILHKYTEGQRRCHSFLVGLFDGNWLNANGNKHSKAQQFDQIGVYLLVVQCNGGINLGSATWHTGGSNCCQRNVMLIIYEAGICEDFLNTMCPRADTTACCYFMLSELDIVKKATLCWCIMSTL